MCGIFFSIGFENLPPSVIDSVSHRGPDGRGWEEFTSPHGPVVMAHRRLAIVDLSDDGKQPMSTEDGRFWMTYNGEIYNYLEIRKELEELGYHFRTKTDTEVLLKSYLHWREDCLHHFNGMFSFVIWDDKDKKVFAARDRFGVKPLYYYRQGNKIAFASEIKQFIEVPGFEANTNHDHLSFFILNKYQPISDKTLFQNINLIEPGHYATYDLNQYVTITWYTPQAYNLKSNSYEEAFLELFQNAVQKRLISDAPVGALLSGGLDSSSIVCMIGELMKSNPSCRDIQTFTSWSPDPEVDEQIYSNAVIEKTGLFNYLAEIKSDSLQSDIEKIIYHQEEPFVSTSLQSEWNIYQTISGKTELKVVLDGQGSDELTCGYLSMIPHLLSHYIKNKSSLIALREFLNTIRIHKNISSKTLSIDILSKTHPKLIYYIQKIRGKYFQINDHEIFDTFQNYTLYLLRRSIEPQLRWQDRSSMAFSIESRHPFLDYKLVEFLISLPLKEKFNHGNTKMIIRKSMNGILPEIVRNRVTKFGFPSPQEKLMKTFDKDYFSKYLKQGSEILENYQDNAYRNSLIAFDQSGKINQNLFFVFSLGLWSDKFQLTQ